MGEYRQVASLDDLPPGASLCVEVEGAPVALFNVEGRVYAITNICPHAGGPLSEGLVSATVVSCPWHGWPFDLTDGSLGFRPGGPKIRTYPVRVEGDTILVRA